MAEVRMDLAELEKIKQEVIIQKANVAKKEEELVQLQLTLKEVESNKRIVRKTIRDNTNGIGVVYLDGGRIRHKIMEGVRNGRIPDIEYIITSSIISNSIFGRNESGTIAIHAPSNNFGKNEETTEYINFEDVQVELKQRAEDRVAKELGTLRDKSQEMETRISQIRAENKEAISQLNKEHSKEKAVLEGTIGHLEDKYEDLLHDKDTRSTEIKLQEEINKLREELQKEKSKSWLSKFF